jgi:hypothetical protein
MTLLLGTLWHLWHLILCRFEWSDSQRWAWIILCGVGSLLGLLALAMWRDW